MSPIKCTDFAQISDPFILHIQQAEAVVSWVQPQGEMVAYRCVQRFAVRYLVVSTVLELMFEGGG